jgi:hypothetical protein
LAELFAWQHARIIEHITNFPSGHGHVDEASGGGVQS